MAYLRLFAMGIVIVFSLQEASAFSDTDVSPDNGAIQMLYEHGIVEGYSDGTFRPNALINRAEFLKIVMRATRREESSLTVSSRCFTDFQGEEEWYWKYACEAKDKGIIQGHPDGTFRGEDTVQLAEALKMSIEAWNIPVRSLKEGEFWYQPYMEIGGKRGVFSVFPWNPGFPLNRGEMARLLVELDEQIADLSSEQQDDMQEVPVPDNTVPYCGNGIVEDGEQCDDGNTENGDGCSELCIVVSEPLRHGALRIEQVPITTENRSAGAKNVPLFAFQAIAGRQDVYLTQVYLTSTQGSLQYAENYRLMIDTDGDGIVDSLYGQASADGEVLAFSNLHILVKDGQYRRVELWADIQISVSSGEIAVGFYTADNGFIEGVDAIDSAPVSGIELDNGGCLQEDVCWIAVYTADTQVLSLGMQGNLYITRDSSVSGSAQVLAGELSPVLLRLSFLAEGEDIRLETLAIDGIPSSVDHLQLFAKGASSPFATARSSACITIVSGRMCMDGDVVFPEGEEKDVDIRVFLKNDQHGAVSGQNMTLRIRDAVSGNVAIEAVGHESGRKLHQNDQDSSPEGEIIIGRASAGVNSAISSSQHTVVFAGIDRIRSTSSDTDGSPITLGENVIAQFTFDALKNTNTKNGENTATISALRFTVTAQSVSFAENSFSLFNSNNASVAVSCAQSAPTGVFTVVCSHLDTSAVHTAITSGESVELALRGEITAVDTQGSPLVQAQLQSLGNASVTGTVEWSDEESTFGWVDVEENSVKGPVYQ